MHGRLLKVYDEEEAALCYDGAHADNDDREETQFTSSLLSLRVVLQGAGPAV